MRIAPLVFLLALTAPAVAFAQQVPTALAYCVASDGHYVLFSDLFPPGNHTIEEMTQDWKDDLKSAKPHIDMNDDRTYAFLSCYIEVGIPSQVEMKRASSVVDGVRTTRSVRSFSMGWRMY